MFDLRFFFVAPLAALVVGSVFPLLAQDVGDVVELKQETTLRVSKELGDKVPGGTKLLVKAKNGKWLWVEYNKPGWIDTAHVNLLDKAGKQWAALASAEKKEAVKQLWRAGASIDFSPEGEVVGVNTTFRSLSPGALKHVTSLDDVKMLILIASSLSDDDLAHLAGLRKLEQLFLGVNKITGKGLAHLKEIASLKGLYLMLTSVDDDGLVHLANLPALEELRLSQTPVSDKGLVHLAKVPKLASLELAGTAVGPAGAKDLVRLTQLRLLDLSGTRMNDEGLAELQGLESLEILSLHNCKAVTAAGIAHLAGCKKLSLLSLGDVGTLGDDALKSAAAIGGLKGLDISGNRVTDAGLAHLHRLSNLEELRVAGNRHTPAGLAALRKALPKLKIQE